jgi:aspartyl/asparaginyl-tRNA synthetase
MVAKGVLNNGEHTLIPVMAKMIHSAVWECKRLVLKDGQPLHMVKFVGAVRNFPVNNKYVQINMEDGTELVQVILWREQKEGMAQRCLIHKCNSNCYICVIGEVGDYYGVHEIIAFNV